MKHTDNTLYSSHYKAYLEKAVSYQQYKQNMQEELALVLQDSAPQASQLDYLLINQQRMKRVEKTFQPNRQLLSLIQALPSSLHWLVLSEHWCGDAAQNLPVLAALAQASAGKISLKILYRDQHLDLMDAFLSNGARAIPRLIQLNSQLELKGVWGPRPAEAQYLVKQLKSDPATAASYGEQLHKWYALNKQQAIQEELQILLERTFTDCIECPG